MENQANHDPAPEPGHNPPRSRRPGPGEFAPGWQKRLGCCLLIVIIILVAVVLASWMAVSGIDEN